MELTVRAWDWTVWAVATPVLTVRPWNDEVKSLADWVTVVLNEDVWREPTTIVPACKVPVLAVCKKAEEASNRPVRTTPALILEAENERELNATGFGGRVLK
jgi:hypothetical protein